MRQPYLISAIGTPLDSDDGLHVEGLYQHLDDQASASIDGVLVAGTMGLMQLLADERTATWSATERRIGAVEARC